MGQLYSHCGQFLKPNLSQIRHKLWGNITQVSRRFCHHSTQHLQQSIACLQGVKVSSFINAGSQALRFWILNPFFIQYFHFKCLDLPFVKLPPDWATFGLTWTLRKTWPNFQGGLYIESSWQDKTSTLVHWFYRLAFCPSFWPEA